MQRPVERSVSCLASRHHLISAVMLDRMQEAGRPRRPYLGLKHGKTYYWGMHSCELLHLKLMEHSAALLPAFSLLTSLGELIRWRLNTGFSVNWGRRPRAWWTGELSSSRTIHI